MFIPERIDEYFLLLTEKTLCAGADGCPPVPKRFTMYG